MNARLTLVELIDLLAESTSTSKRVCELFLRELFSTISQALINGETVKVKHIGTFKVTAVKPRKSVNVADGEDIELQGHRKIVFTPDKSLAEAVNQPFAQFETVMLDDALTDEKLAAIDEQYPSVALASPVAEKDSGDEVKEVGDEEKEVGDEVKDSGDEVKETVPQQRQAETVTGTEVNFGTDAPEPGAPEPIERKPMLVGIPIDGPSHPVPERPAIQEPEVDDHFYRPALRDAYSPTPEQLSPQPRRWPRWLWVVLAAAVAVGILWLVLDRHGLSDTTETPVVDTAELYTPEPAVVTDTVTARIVLSTLSEKYYDSPWFWVYIYEENKDKISNPDNVPPGTEVVIPPAEKYDIDANDPASLKRAQRRSWEILKLGKR